MGTVKPDRSGPKKFKGKKKVKNLDEKKAKGIRMNKMDRKKYSKLQEKRKLMDSVHSKVKSELEHMDEGSMSSSLSESSFGSQPPPKKKRVSFAEALEHKKLFDKNDKSLEIKASTASPGKSILKEKALKKKKQMEKKRLLKKEKEEKMEVDDEKENEDEEMPSTPTGKPLVAKEKKKISVPRNLKEKLLAMPRKERKKFLLELRAARKPHMEMGQEAKTLWEKIRSRKTPQAEKDETIEKLIKLVKGHSKKLIYAHDTSRVFECLITLGRDDVHKMLYEELMPEIVRMAKSKFARFFVSKMLKFGSKHERDTIISAFRGHCVSIFRITWGSDVLETAYNDYANPQQRFDIISEFYGREFVMFRTEGVKTLQQIVTAEPSKQKLIAKHLEEIVMDIVEKNAIKHSLTHKLMLDLMTIGDEEQRDNLIDSIKDKIAEIVHTPEGSRVAMKTIFFTNAKDRKLIVKNFKDLAVKAACEQYGSRVLMAIFDNVDDTVLVNKFITSELANNVKTVVDDKYGVKVAHYIVHPRDGRVMDKTILDQLREGDGNANSKKPFGERYLEIFKAFSTPLFTYMAANLEELSRSRVETSMLILDSFEAHGRRELFTRVILPADRHAVYEAIAVEAAKEFIPADVGNEHLIEHNWAGFMFGKLLRSDGELPEEERLSTHLLKLSDETIGSWVACNKGCFALVRMFENGSEKVQKKVAKSVSVKRLQGYSHAGSKTLLQCLGAS